MLVLDCPVLFIRGGPNAEPNRRRTPAPMPVTLPPDRCRAAARSPRPGGAESGRTARKRRAIMEAATALFLRDGYRNTSMDQVAADAAVSKQTV